MGQDRQGKCNVVLASNCSSALHNSLCTCNYVVRCSKSKVNPRTDHERPEGE